MVEALELIPMNAKSTELRAYALAGRLAEIARYLDLVQRCSAGT